MLPCDFLSGCDLHFEELVLTACRVSWNSMFPKQTQCYERTL